MGPPSGPCRGPLPRGACSRLDVTRTREREREKNGAYSSKGRKQQNTGVLLDIELPTCRQGEVVLAIITMQSSTRVMRRRRRRKGSFQIVFRSTRRKGTKREAQKSKNASPVETEDEKSWQRMKYGL